MSASSTPRPTGTRPAGSPAGALGPLSLGLGTIAAVSTWPTLTFFLLPWSVLAAAFAVTFGCMGIHYAGRGYGRLWTSVTGTVLGAVGLGASLLLLTLMS
ncbi:hypothetical protein [Streptomyces camelliae]|uniref:DUF4190 domain-containing protein n=1 Tax=Streptomyces camelliae TaxID=3004093 RepID=A0ABY7NWH2_9ACTN|nr:hypothetical protein [Streptomyces sp. HUAS 2-6]WBO62566.1 hypothetical protein O1G22_06905 [Streptomyces sp. HUAS 2-6]